MDRNLDCILVGYNELDFGSMVEKQRPFASRNGAYSYLKANSVLLDGRRLSYTELLNRALSQATGQQTRYNVFDLPNLACCYLASYLRRRGHAIEIVNFFNHDQELFRQLLERRPRAVAITTTFYTDSAPITEIVKFIREHDTDVRIIVGGPHIFNVCKNYDAATQDYVFDSMGADLYVNDPQGEHTLHRLLIQLRDRGDLSSVPNLIYRTSGAPASGAPPDAPAGSYVRTRREQEANDMNEGSIDWSHIDRGLITPATQTRTARSCAYKCAFCTFPEMAGELSLTDVDVIERELRYLQSIGVKYLTFIDDTFNIPLPRFKELCRMMIRNRFEFRWFSHFRPANADDEAFKLMAESGCMAVFLGVESGDQGVLNNMNKVAKVERYERGIELLHKYGILTFGSFIAGFPGETAQSIENTIRFIDKTGLTYYQIALYYHFDGTPIGRRRQEFGLQGAGYTWKHNTMTWKEASVAVEHMYRSIKNSSVLPLLGFDFFGLPYWLSKGVSVEQFTGFLRLSQQMLVRSFNDEPVDFRPLESELVALFSQQPAARISAGAA